VATRRTVLSSLSLLTCGAVLLRALPARAALRPGEDDAFFQKYKAPEKSSFRASNTPEGEKGDRMVIRGVVIDADKKPIANASVYAYHTDAAGRYNNEEPRPAFGGENPRLHGYMRTDSAGRYEYQGVRPAAYPGLTLPAHVHFVVQADGFQPRVFEFWFEGDPMITNDHLAGQAKDPERFLIRKAVKDSQNVWQITNDIAMERK
jgi:protocatechuate 3,4-dioxygenase beta subunit